MADALAAADRLPDGLLLAYYGDDFTGSTDALEAMTAAGLPTVLFLEPPAPDPWARLPRLLARFPDARCVGLAGSSRARDPAWMDAHLPAAFDTLARLGAPILQYKVCSTFDSSPAVGSIGKAIDLGVSRMPGDWSPCVVGAPRLGRFQVFGNLFAVAGGTGHRLDRHPTMSCHPVTPMDEADLPRHLARQTARPIALVDMLALRRGDAQPPRRVSGEVPAVFIDVVDEQTLAQAGRLVWEQRGPGLFSASSSGLDYALTAWWRARGWLPEPPGLPPAAPAPVIAAVSGSCSPVTAGQIRWARAHGFRTERLDLARALARDARAAAAEIARAARVAVDALRGGASAIVFSAEGPDDPAVTGFDAVAASAGLSRGEAARRVGECLAAVMRGILAETRLQRIVVAGGDSSGEVASALGIDALTAQAAIVPGAPLCRAWSADPARDGLEIVLKGGQIGGDDFFGKALGQASRI
ncbi:3-oxo-isoapionate kinase OiaK [Zeimonas arvi]|uniref:3-oxo-isoapionate kinase OiaK n=1 Tax=Zeimonas arvi TaxID=2498847 RepID=UPI001CED07C0|nr:3-oxo-isoapionate kinase OiaK [Zeimonas arvi]